MSCCSSEKEQENMFIQYALDLLFLVTELWMSKRELV